MRNACLGRVGARLLQLGNVANPKPNDVWSPRLRIVERSQMIGCVKGLNGLMLGRDVLADENVNVTVVYLCHVSNLIRKRP
jgi:hypothetical protein